MPSGGETFPRIRLNRFESSPDSSLLTFILKGLIQIILTCRKGTGLVEYAVMIAFVAIVLIVIVGSFGDKIDNTFSSIKVPCRNARLGKRAS
jgi:Flp pilus assembly pilin Flp